MSGSNLPVVVEPGRPSRVYVRHQQGQPRLVKYQEPLSEKSACADWDCPQCGEGVGTTHPIALVAVAPDDVEQVRRFLAGAWFTCWAAVLHGGCATVMSEDDLGELALRMVMVPLAEQLMRVDLDTVGAAEDLPSAVMDAMLPLIEVYEPGDRRLLQLVREPASPALTMPHPVLRITVRCPECGTPAERVAHSVPFNHSGSRCPKCGGLVPSVALEWIGP